jgi:hypothetical protein
MVISSIQKEEFMSYSDYVIFLLTQGPGVGGREMKCTVSEGQTTGGQGDTSP